MTEVIREKVKWDFHMPPKGDECAHIEHGWLISWCAKVYLLLVMPGSAGTRA